MLQDHHRTYHAAWIPGEWLVLWTDGSEESLANHAAFPILTALPAGGALLAWEENKGIAFKRL